MEFGCGIRVNADQIHSLHIDLPATSYRRVPALSRFLRRQRRGQSGPSLRHGSQEGRDWSDQPGHEAMMAVRCHDVQCQIGLGLIDKLDV
jgi:hypothetical protein